MSKRLKWILFSSGQSKLAVNDVIITRRRNDMLRVYNTLVYYEGISNYLSVFIYKVVGIKGSAYSSVSSVIN